MSERYVCYVDGGCWPNPGPGARAACLAGEDGSVVCEAAYAIDGTTTNMRAEYEALRLGVQLALLCAAPEVHFITDCQTMAQQVIGHWTIKDDEIRRLHDAVSVEIRRIDHWSLTFLPRANNIRADWLVNTVLRPDDKRALNEPKEQIVFRTGNLMSGWRTMGKRAA